MAIELEALPGVLDLFERGLEYMEQAGMTQAEPTVASPERPDEIVSVEVERLKREAKERTAAARVLSTLSKPATWSQPKKLAAAHKKALAKIPKEIQASCGIDRVLESVGDHVLAAPERTRRELGHSLAERCAREGLTLRVVSREGAVELRIVPLSVVIDFEKGRAQLRFARDVLAECPAGADEIVATYRKTMKSLEGGLAPNRLFEACLAAYERCIRLDGKPEGERIELLRFLPELAYALQPKRFFENPTAKTFQSYPRGHFAYDVLRLRREGGLARNGWRMNFGVATGSTASDRKRVLYLEDGDGNGEFKLTIFFTRE